VIEALAVVLNVAGGAYLLLLAIRAFKRTHVPPDVSPGDNYLVVVVTVGTERVLPTLRETVAQLRRLGL
jgi:threonine/homoserine/homoserine lactone efflux protein